MYYLRTKAATDAIKFTVDKNVTGERTQVDNVSIRNIELEQEAIACSLDDPENCEMCSGWFETILV